MTGQRPDPPAAVVLVVLLACLVAGGLLVASGQARPEPAAQVDRASYGAGWRHAVAHQSDPRPSGLPGGADGTRADCQLWVDAVVRGIDRDDFLAGCADATNTKGSK